MSGNIKGPPRTWRTRQDPFAAVWPQVLRWLDAEPDATAKELFARLDADQPGEFKPGQLRTLQRRVHEWRQERARELVHASLGPGQGLAVEETLPSGQSDVTSAEPEAP